MHTRPVVPVPIALLGHELHYGNPGAIAYTHEAHTDLAEYATARTRPVVVPKHLGGDDQAMPIWSIRCPFPMACMACRTYPCITVPSRPKPPPIFLALHQGLQIHAREIRLPGNASFLVVPPGATVDDVNAAATAWVHGERCEHQLHAFHLAESLGGLPADSYVVLPIVSGAHIDLTEMFSDAGH